MALSYDPEDRSQVAINAIVEHLFRHEYGKLVSILVRAVGMSKLDDVEDIVQESLMAAMTGWSFGGVPANPTGWLVTVAKNKMVDMMRRRSIASKVFVPLLPGFHEAAYALEIDKLVLDWEIGDSQLRMMFVCAHPGISKESRIALMLKTLCGFSVREIASAFVTKDDTIEKRLGRARKYFRDHQIPINPPTGKHLQKRLDTILSCLYLLFNEGYKRTESMDDLINRDLCLEAQRLAQLLADHPQTNSPETYALLALMMFHSARLDSRTDEQGDIVLLSAQDRTKWNRPLIERAMHYLTLSEPDINTSTYHIEATIQSVHATSPSFERTDWAVILGLYRRLYELKQSPIVALHMSVSIGQVHGPEAEIEHLLGLPLADYYLYHAILGDAFAKAGHADEAAVSFARAIELTMNSRERVLLEERLAGVK